MKVLSIAGGATGTVQLNYCPEILMIKAATVPTKVQVRALGEGVVCDLDGTHLTALSNLRQNLVVGGYFAIPLADGILKKKNIEIEVTAAATTQTEVYVYSTGEAGENYIVSERNTILANTSQSFSKFFALALSDMPSGAMVTITYASKETQVFTHADEIKALALENNTEKLVIDNFEQDIKRVDIVTPSQITVSILKLRL